jgi:hypothetical protein
MEQCEHHHCCHFHYETFSLYPFSLWNSVVMKYYHYIFFVIKSDAILKYISYIHYQNETLSLWNILKHYVIVKNYEIMSLWNISIVSNFQDVMKHCHYETLSTWNIVIAKYHETLDVILNLKYDEKVSS